MSYESYTELDRELRHNSRPNITIPQAMDWSESELELPPLPTHHSSRQLTVPVPLQNVVGSRTKLKECGLLPLCFFSTTTTATTATRASSIIPTVATSTTSYYSFVCLILLVFLSLHCPNVQAQSDHTQAFFNRNSSISIPNSQWDLHERKQFSFKTCTDSGNLLSMRGYLIAESDSSSISSPTSSSSSSSSSSSQELTLSLHNKSVMFVWSIDGQSGSVSIGSDVNNNKWYTLALQHRLGALLLSLSEGSVTPSPEVTVADTRSNAFLLDIRLAGTLEVGRGFRGCIYNGQGVNLSSTNVITSNIQWDVCPLNGQESGCGDIDNCWNSPCVRGQCEDIGDDFRCNCPRKFGGKTCEIDLVRLYACGADPCMNGGRCVNLTEDAGGRNYECECLAGYTGVDCETFLDLCRSNPCINGRCVNGVSGYACNCQGSGYQGDSCSEDVNECRTAGVCGPNRCSNHPGGYSCNCPSGYEGTPCVEIDECASSPCKYGASCTDSINSYECACVPGYTGSNCEVDIDDCTNTPCTDQNTQCVDGVNTFECRCQDGFSGSPPNCNNIDECSLSVCKNNASCADTPGGYTCNCLPGFTDQNCEVDIDECSDNPCKNNASCTDRVNDYNCACLDGFRGKNCEVDIDDCMGVTCLNGAKCVDKVNAFECVCQDGWEGQYCQMDIDDCALQPCKNGGRCSDQVNGFSCDCRAGYNGTTCSVNIDDCVPNPCDNEGVCFDGINEFACDCTSDWMGDRCEEMYDACSFKPCENGGNCTTRRPVREYSCNCPVGLSGKNCEIDIVDCLPNVCASYQICEEGINTYTCKCPVAISLSKTSKTDQDEDHLGPTGAKKAGYSGDLCETEINECEAHPCRNNATCQDGRGFYNCSCPQEVIDISKEIGPDGIFLTGYNGTNCEIDINECAYTDPPICQNDAICKNNPPGSFTCYCKSEADDGSLNVGKLCEVQKTYCDLAPKQCANGGTCEELRRSYKCNCAPGFTGPFCEEDIDECESNPCQQGGSCSDRVNGYVCTCIEGITGQDCEIDINDCVPEPCYNGGQCQDHINSFSCNCSDTGFRGDRCQDNINDCVSKNNEPVCQHGGSCKDGVKEYMCNCTAGYDGPNCELDIPECAAVPCYMGSLCLEYSNETLYDLGDLRFVNFSYEKAAGYVCDCVPGLEGVNCTEDIDECKSNPCINGAVCINNFNAFHCQCAPGYQGKMCQKEIDECQVHQPCKNGGMCADLVADYFCTCPEPIIRERNYGGKNCTTYLSGCDGNSQCGANGDCLPKLISEDRNIHSFSCVCHAGYTGDFCDSSTVFSFRSGAYIRQEMTEFQFDLSLRFRTTLSDAVLVVCKLGFEHWIALRIHDGKIEFKHHDPEFNQPSSWGIVNSMAPVNDAHFHTVQMRLTPNITIILPDDSCILSSSSSSSETGTPCHVEQNYIRALNPSNPILYIGDAHPVGLITLDGTGLETNYVGCMEDVIFNGNLYYPGLPKRDMFHLVPGCSYIPQCQDDTCNKRGVCKDLWNEFECQCQRPYYGNQCEKDFTPATFGGNPDDSFASFTLRPPPDENFPLSFMVTTRQNNGFIIYAGNDKISQPSEHTFISLYIHNGFLMGDFLKCTYVNRFTTTALINDGNSHLIGLSVNSEQLKISVDTISVYYNDTIPATGQCEFYVTKVNVGSLEEPSSTSNGRRKKRWADRWDMWTMNDARIVETHYTSRRVKRQTAGDIYTENQQRPPFEGVLQDLRAYDSKLSFSANDTEGSRPDTLNAALGATSTEVICKDQPCQNGGNCSEKYFNDFSCDCKRGYTGKNCSELDFCSYGSCPQGSQCVNIQDGYECISTAQFSGSGLMTFDLSGATAVEPKVSISFRTRSSFGVVLYTGENSRFIKLRIARGYLEVNYKLRLAEFSKSVRTSISKLVNDGEWYTVNLELVDNGTALEFGVSHNEMSVAGKRRIDLDFVDAGVDVLSMMVSGPTLLLGGAVIPLKGFSREASFVGCMKEARIGGILLPYFPDSQFVNNTASVKYLLKTKDGVTDGCTGPDVCQTSKCVNGGKCVDLWYASKCECVAGYSGDICQENEDNCQGRVCGNNGRCVDGLDSFSCWCDTGYTGERCEDAVDYCSSATNSGGNGGPCLNNGVCLNESGGYRCNCTEEFTGWNCSVQRNQSCTSGSSICKNEGICNDINVTIDSNLVPSFECKCSAGFEGPLCEMAINGCDMNPCKNGECTQSSVSPFYSCNCSGTDFRDQNCSEQMDNCVNGLCGNHGTCEDLNQDYTCHCDPGYTGKACETALDKCDYKLCQHGTCQNNTCDCTGSGYTGEFCDQDLNECDQTNPTCVNANNCTNLEGSFKCTCELGFTGDRCDKPNCTGLCQNGGNCETNATQWWCNCAQFYEGQQCEIKGPCADQPCDKDNAKECIQNVTDSSYTCVCEPGWEGKNCTVDIDECTDTKHPDNCTSNGQCKNRDGTFICDCYLGYTTFTCGEDIDECKPRPCLHNGICIDMNATYECNCNDTGFVGKNCEEDIDECTKTPGICHNGTCVNNDSSYNCDCGHQFLGNFCEYEDPCYKESSCLNNGLCQKNQTQDGFDSYCMCGNDYEGTRCEKSKSKDDDLDLAFIIGPIVGSVVFVIIIIMIIAFILTTRSKRATRGAYSPSQQETSGSRVELGNVLKKPPEERLI